MRTVTPIPALALFVALAACAASPQRSAGVERAPAEIIETLGRAFAMKPARDGAARHVRVPHSAAGALHVGVDDATFVELHPQVTHDVRRRDEGGVAVFAGALDDVDLVYVVERDRVEELRLAHTLAAAAATKWSFRLGGGLVGLRVHDGRLEAFDAKGTVRLATEPAWAADANGTRRPLAFAVDGTTITASLDVDGLTAPIAIDPAWTVPAAMDAPRLFPIVAKLSTGKLLVAGGVGPSLVGLDTASLYDPATNTFESTASKMAFARTAQSPTFVVYDDGKKVLLTDGRSADASVLAQDAEIYDVTSNAFTRKTMPVPSRRHGAVLLNDKRVAVIGGKDYGNNYHRAIRIYDPATGAWSSTTELIENGGRVDFRPVVLGDGRVLIAGGVAQSTAGSGVERPVVEPLVWDPVAKTVTRVARLPVGRAQYVATLLTSGPNAGKAMLYGGVVYGADESASPTPSAGSILYDPNADSWSAGPPLTAPRVTVGASLLPDGRVLVTGGADFTASNAGVTDTAEIYDPLTNLWSPAGRLAAPRGGHSQITVDGAAYVFGGAAGASEGFVVFSANVERFALQGMGATCGTPGECASGFCVDGVCCGTSCAGQCAACDVPGSVGACTPVKGAPHGNRARCSDDAKSDPTCGLTCNGVDVDACKFPAETAPCSSDTCVTGVETHGSTCDGSGRCKDVPRSCGDFVCGATACKVACATRADCVNPNHFCEIGKCIPVLPNASPCTRDEACASGSCVDGTCCESKCAGQCEACDVPGQAGKCVAVKGKPHGGRTSCAVDASDACQSKVCDGTNTAACAATIGPCAAYACDTASLSCKATCGGDDDCAEGYECSGSKCVPRASKCSADLTELIGKDGVRSSCAPYLCRDGLCVTACRSSVDCLGGYVCDGAGVCVSSSPPTVDEGGGCTYGGHRREGCAAGFAVAIVLAVRARRSRCRRAQR